MESEVPGTIPIISLYRDLIVVVQGSLTDAQVTQLKSDTTRAIARHDAQGLIISVAGVDLMDSYISRSIHDLALVARYMGVETVVCGISPLVATTLVEMDMGLRGISTALNLEHALEMLIRNRRTRARVGRARDADTALLLEGDAEGADEALVFAAAEDTSSR